MDAILLIDGENIKGKIKDVFKEFGKEKPVWHEYNFKSLFDKILGGINVNKKVFYFAKIKEHKKSIEKSKQLIEEQRLLKTHLEKQGFGVILRGSVRGQIENHKGKEVLVFEDSISGFSAAKKAGMTLVAIKNDQNKDILYQADFAIDDYTQAGEIFKKVSKIVNRFGELLYLSIKSLGEF